MRWRKVTIIGVGLLGGSIGLAIRKRNLAREVYGFVRRQAALRESVKAGTVHRAGMDLMEAVSDSDLVILCTPIDSMAPLVQQMLPALKPGTIVTDVGSVKVQVVRALGSKIRKAGGHFVGSHPMAGSEKGGVGRAQEDLFERAFCVVTPESRTNRKALEKVQRFWESLGLRVLPMDAALHDKLVSRSSHLPHLVASTLAWMVLDPKGDPRQSRLCATGFRDTTRIASGMPDMWRDIAMANRKYLVRDLAQYEKNLRKLRQMLSDGDAAGVEAVLRTARERRSAWKEPAGKPCSSE